MSFEFDNFPFGAPHGTRPFKIDIPQKSLETLQAHLQLSELPKPTYESSLPDRRLGITHEWLSAAKSEWQHSCDWRKHERHMNSFPQFIAPIKDEDGKTYDIHFVALFSGKKDAIPIVLCHGWPGSFLEFLPMFDILRKRHSPAELPYHLVVPSLPGYTFSSPPPLDKDFGIHDVARLFDKLMVSLGFGTGYVAQGGDVGSKVSRVMCAEHEACKALHINFCIIPEPEKPIVGEISNIEREGLERAFEFKKLGSAYALEHATKPSTIGFTVSASPISMLAWIGEKFLDWTDEDPSIELILESVSLYWLTGCFSTTIYPYRQLFTPGVTGAHEMPKWYIAKPKKFGYSFFPKELAPIPRAWAATTGDLIWSREHSSGGHFAAVERTTELLEDIEDFIAENWEFAI